MSNNKQKDTPWAQNVEKMENASKQTIISPLIFLFLWPFVHFLVVFASSLVSNIHEWGGLG
jgi:hypothetical protein